MIQPLFKALSNDADEALKEKPGGGALDDDEDPETNNRSGGALPISGGGESEALPEAVATVIAKTGTTEDDKTQMATFVALYWLKVDTHVSLAQECASTCATADKIEAHGIHTKQSERQLAESKLRSFVLQL